MRLICETYQMSIEFYENKVSVLTIEDPDTFANLLQGLYGQLPEADQGFVLFEGNKKLSLDKCAEIVSDPFALHINNRKVLGKLYQELKEISDEDHFLTMKGINTQMVGYLDELCLKVPYPIHFRSEVDVQEIFKVYGIELELTTGSLTEKLITYMEVMRKLCHVSLMIFINVKCFLNESQLLELYKAASYCKMNVLLVENTQRMVLDGESNTILDAENCLIQF